MYLVSHASNRRRSRSNSRSRDAKHFRPSISRLSRRRTSNIALTTNLRPRFAPRVTCRASTRSAPRGRPTVRATRATERKARPVKVRSRRHRDGARLRASTARARRGRPARAWAPPLAPSSMKTYLLPRPREAIGVRSLVRYAIGKACARDDRFSVVHVARASRRVADARVRLRRYARARVVVITNSRCHPSRAMHSECTHTHTHTAYPCAQYVPYIR